MEISVVKSFEKIKRKKNWKYTFSLKIFNESIVFNFFGRFLKTKYKEASYNNDETSLENIAEGNSQRWWIRESDGTEYDSTRNWAD